MRKAKIVCTLGPTSNTEAEIRRLMEAGMDMARLNLSHGSHDDHRRIHDLVRRIAASLGRPVATLMDLQGPKIRVGRMTGGEVLLASGSEVVLTTRDCEGTPELIPHTYRPLSQDAAPGSRILLDDGRLELEVLRREGEDLRCRVQTGGLLSDRKGMNLPGIALSTPSLTEKDRDDLALGVSLGVDYLAISFVRRPEDLLEARRVAGSIPLIAKIEKPEALACFEAILEAADGIMVARGDLGVELGPERVPLCQKQIIEQTNRAGKVVITATEMLDSMRERPRPTRAEASDVANAVLDGTDALMLSGETAAGRYPVETVRTMDRIIREVESSSRFCLLPEPASMKRSGSTHAVARAAVVAAREIAARAILCYTESGATATLISEYRPQADILAVTDAETVYRRLALHWGVRPLLVDHRPSTDETIDGMVQAALAAGLVEHGEFVVLTMGSRKHGASDLMKIHEIV